jgi:hypothetical protein
MLELSAEPTHTDIREDVMYVPDTVPDEFMATFKNSLESVGR